MNLTLEDTWDVIKEGVIPIVAVIGGYFLKEIDKIKDDCEKKEEQINELEKKVIFVESTYATKAEVAAMLSSINTTLLNNNNSLEAKIEKLMDLKNLPIKVMLEELYRNQERDK